ncbi:OmpH/Skp family outer membrane protein [Niabella terrae]
MKQVKFIVIALGLVIAGGLSAGAQKIGYVNVDALVYNLPEAQKTQQEFQQWQQDSVGGTYTKLMNEYQEKDSLHKAATNASVKSALENDLNRLGQILGTWEQRAQEVSQAKRGQLFGPLYKKVMDAINAYAKEKGYTHVLDQQVVVVAPPGDILNIPIAQKLGIKVDAEGNVTPPAGATAPAAGGAK